MLNIVSFVLNLVDQHVLWLYLALIALLLIRLRDYAAAHRDRLNTVFSIEKEVAAHREGRAMSAIGTILGVAAVVTAVKFYLVPTIDLAALSGPTPTATLRLQVPTAEPTPTEAPTAPPASPTPRPRPSLAPQLSATPAVTAAPPTAPPAKCPDPNVRITSPGMGATVSGSVPIIGTATGSRFQFYKVEIGPGAQPLSWHVVRDLHRAPVTGGTLETLDTHSVSNGVYVLRLTVVDATGNFPPPCEVQIRVQN